MKKRLLLLMVALSAVALSASSYQKDADLKPGQQPGTKSAHNFSETFNLQGDGQAKDFGSTAGRSISDEVFGPIVDWSKLKQVVIKLDPNSKKRTMNLQLQQDGWPDLGGKKKYLLKVFDYALKSNSGGSKTWHSKHIATIEVKKDFTASLEVFDENFFASKGIGDRKMRIYLPIETSMGTAYRALWTLYYTEENKVFLDEFTQGIE